MLSDEEIAAALGFQEVCEARAVEASTFAFYATMPIWSLLVVALSLLVRDLPAHVGLNTHQTAAAWYLSTLLRCAGNVTNASSLGVPHPRAEVRKQG